MARQLMRKRSGSQPVSQSGWSFGPANIIREPSDDWCIVGSSMPRAMIQISDLLRIGRRRFEHLCSSGGPSTLNFSMKAGDSSIQSTKT